MSLVAYDNSSDSESDLDSSDYQPALLLAKEPATTPNTSTASGLCRLPKPKEAERIRVETEDEFLLKKAVPSEKPPIPKGRGPVKIIIPHLRDLGADLTSSVRKSKVSIPMNKPMGLLNILPRPKADKPFARAAFQGPLTSSTTCSFVPHSVAKKKTACTSSSLPIITPETGRVLRSKTTCDSSDEDTLEGSTQDFFALTRQKEELPTVSNNEINVLIAKRAARFEENMARFDRLEEQHVGEDSLLLEFGASAPDPGPSGNGEEVNEVALQSLIGGSRAKRTRINVDMIELTHEQVMPNRGEWLRTSIAGSTQAQVRGQLRDGPKGMAKKKHQITYLAHQAKSNEAELQAIWAANRTTQRQSQSKYGW